MANVLNIIRIIAYICTIVVLISSIKTRNKYIVKNNLIISIFIIIYLFIDSFILPNIFGIETGFELLVIYFFSIVSSILSIISIIINKKKITKKLKQEGPFFIKEYKKLIILPIIAIIMTFAYEITIINNAEIVLIYDYNIGIIDEEIAKVAVNKKYSKVFTISEKFKNKEAKEIEHIVYEVMENDANEIIILNSYQDPEYKKLDIKLIKKIFKNDNYKKNKTAINLHKNDCKTVHKAYITLIEGTNYYIVEHLLSEENEGGGTLLGSAIFYNDKMIDNVNVSGDIDKIYFYNK